MKWSLPLFRESIGTSSTTDNAFLVKARRHEGTKARRHEGTKAECTEQHLDAKLGGSLIVSYEPKKTPACRGMQTGNGSGVVSFLRSPNVAGVRSATTQES